MTTRVLTYNVHSCRGMDGRIDVGRIADVILAAQADVVALQELDVGRSRSGHVDQAHALASRLGMGFHFNAALHVEEEQYGDAILTALPMTLVKTGALPTLPRVRGLERRGALWVEVTANNGVRVQIINTHLGLVPQEQRLQAACLLSREWLGHPRCSGPTVLLGDFNATPRYAAYKSLAGRLRDVRRARGVRRVPATFPSRLPVLRLDHIFCSPAAAPVKVHVVNGALARIASDHLPLAADLNLLPQSAG